MTAAIITSGDSPLKAARAPGGRYQLSGPYDPQQRWKGAGGRNNTMTSSGACGASES